MALRLSGLSSGIDTEGIVQQLMNAQNLKKHKIQSKTTKLEWKQDKWKELNAKIYTLYTDTVSSMRLEGSYRTKKAASTNEAKLSVSAASNAAEGTHTVTVDNLASAQHLTGKALGSDVTGSTKLSDLGFDTGKSIQVKVEGKDAKMVEIDDDTTISEFVNKLKEAGVNANFDNTYKRIFVSAAGSGTDSAFSITTGELSSGAQKTALEDSLKLNELSDTDRQKAKSLMSDLRTAAERGDDEAVESAKEALVKFAQDNYKKTISEEAANAAREAYNASLPEGEEADEEALNAAVKEAVDAALENAEAALEEIETNVGAAADDYVSAVESGDFAGAGTSALGALGLTDVNYTLGEDGAITYDYDENAGATLVKADNARITYNGVSYASSSSTFSINGLTFTANSKTEAGESITVTVTKDVDAVYDKVKNFVTKYNELLKEMNTLYNAPSARSYDVLRDDEKEAMTDDQIEKWETKIKDSLLRRDSTLGSLISSLRTALSGSVNIDGVNHSLAELGITTSDDYSENGLLHIHGDETDPYGVKFTDKFKAALAKDPETVIETMTSVMKNMYSTMSDKMKSSSVSSALTFYNDKEMSKTLKGYQKDLSTLEEKLAAIEDRYYKQFTAMEKAMASLQQQQNSLAGMLGQ